MALDAKKSFGVWMSEDIYPLSNFDETLYAGEILYIHSDYPNTLNFHAKNNQNRS